MSFTDHKITAFTHKVADLPDEPQIPAAELKSRFDACPEELRVAHNAVCDDAARLEARVEGIVVDTFGDTIDKEMLSDELAAELDGKATKTELDSVVDTLETTDAALDTRLTAAETALPEKAECYFGMFNGDGEDSQFISLGFTPKAVLVVSENGGMQDDFDYQGGLALPDHPCLYNSDHPIVTVETNGFRVYTEYFDSNRVIRSNSGNHFYFAVK